MPIAIKLEKETKILDNYETPFSIFIKERRNYNNRGNRLPYVQRFRTFTASQKEKYGDEKKAK